MTEGGDSFPGQSAARGAGVASAGGERWQHCAAAREWARAHHLSRQLVEICPHGPQL